MKCTTCGLPLPPNNTPLICPRCHSTLSAGTKAAPGQTLQPPLYPSQPFNNQGWTAQPAQEDWQRPSQAQEQLAFYNPAGSPVQVQSPTPMSPSSPQWNSNPQYNQLPFLQPEQPWHSASTITPPPSAVPRPQIPPTPPAMFARVDNNYRNPSLPSSHATDNLNTPTSPFALPRTARRKSNLGFIIATCFISTGALLLILVYILALGLPHNNGNSTLGSTPQATRNILPTPTAVASKPTAIPTANTFPAQQYIDNPQMATAVNTSTAQPLQTTTTFNVNQRIYITFAIHPNGKSGAVCLYWYLNNRAVAQFPFSVTADAGAGYSYAIYRSKGSGYIDIYWASTTTCSDKMLAQHVNFTIIA